MGTAKGTRIIAGIIAVSLLAILVYAFQDKYSDDARLAEVIATYFDETDRLVVAVMLHNADGEFTKANGHIELIIWNSRGTEVYSGGYDFTKDDFVTWDNIFLGKQRGVPIVIDQRFPGKSYSGEEYHVFAFMELKSGRLSERLETTFRSYE